MARTHVQVFGIAADKVEVVALAKAGEGVVYDVWLDQLSIFFDTLEEVQQWAARIVEAAANVRKAGQ